MGKPSTSYVVLSACEYIACKKADPEKDVTNDDMLWGAVSKL